VQSVFEEAVRQGLESKLTPKKSPSSSSSSSSSHQHHQQKAGVFEKLASKFNPSHAPSSAAFGFE